MTPVSKDAMLRGPIRQLFDIEPLRRDIWSVGIVSRPIETFVTEPLPAVRWLPEAGRDRYFADPFPFPGRHDTLIVEEYSYLEDRGRLMAIRLPDAERLPDLVEGLQVPGHIAYPFTLEQEGERYCIPDTGDAAEVVLYRWSDGHRRWDKAKQLIHGYNAVDSTVFRHEEKWWLFSSRAQSPTQLHVWYSDDLLGTWLPHEGNPIKTDPRSSRPAGTPFFHQGSWYRPAQDCTRTYGGAVSINRIDLLSPTSFSETTVNVLSPDPGDRYPDGVHTLAAWGDVTIVDGKRRSWRSSRHLLHALARRATSIVPRVARTRS